MPRGNLFTLQVVCAPYCVDAVLLHCRSLPDVQSAVTPSPTLNSDGYSGAIRSCGQSTATAAMDLFFLRRGTAAEQTILATFTQHSHPALYLRHICTCSPVKPTQCGCRHEGRFVISQRDALTPTLPAIRQRVTSKMSCFPQATRIAIWMRANSKMTVTGDGHVTKTDGWHCINAVFWSAPADGSTRK
ncbi:uncharacterized protein IWZ02DRAFT_288939 [Phyllosticta citriasiana]|uniref:uncharacterized protein n=1 Tax=Phyllosticta citriasiana TaxID=595635 RepID=UPI0030FD813D